MWKAILFSWLFALGEYCLQVTILTSFDAAARVRALLISKLYTSRPGGDVAMARARRRGRARAAPAVPASLNQNELGFWCERHF